MKILAIGRNYADHAAELGNAVPTDPVVFLKPDTALLKNNQPFYYPDFSQEIHYETELLVKISREGKHIQEKFAHKYYETIGLGIDFTARDLQNKAKASGLPWEISKAFDYSAVVSDFIPKQDVGDLQNLHFSLQINGQTRQQGFTGDMIFSIDTLIAYVSSFFTLKTGDILFTGTPKGVGKMEQGDLLEGFLGERKMFAFEVR